MTIQECYEEITVLRFRLHDAELQSERLSKAIDDLNAAKEGKPRLQ